MAFAIMVCAIMTFAIMTFVIMTFFSFIHVIFRLSSFEGDLLLTLIGVEQCFSVIGLSREG